MNVFALEDRVNPATAFALSGANLLSFDTASPTIVQTTAVAGVAAGETLVGIDFRPQNGLLYGLGVNATADTATLYAISPRTGFAGVVSTDGMPGKVALTTDGATAVDLPDPATVGYGIDFNPAVDRFRVVAGSLNFRVNPNTGTAVDGDNTGLTSGTVTGTNPDGATNAGTNSVDAAGYTNNQPNNGGVTTLYTLDSVSNSLFIQNPANGGTQSLGQTVTLGGSTLDFTAANGFDIAAGVNAPTANAPVAGGSAFAVLNVGGTTGLYSINLVNAQATLIGNVATGTTAVQGLAIQSDLGGFPAVSLSAAGDALIRFNTATPATTTVQAINLAPLAAGERLVGIDFRPQTGQLYGLAVNATADTGTLYLIDPQLGTLTAVGAQGQVAFVDAQGAAVDLPDPATAGYGFDFNPTVDRIRVTTSTGLNFRVNPVTGAPVDGNLNITANPPAGTNTDAAINGTTGVSATAYTNSFGTGGSPATPAGSTTQYTLDTQGAGGTLRLFIQNPPNAGTQTAALPVTFGGGPLSLASFNGFDIPGGVRVGTSGSAVASGTGYFVGSDAATSSLFRLDLATGVATQVGFVGSGTPRLAGLALADAPAGTVAFAAPTASVAEGGTATINLTRLGSPNGALTVTVNVTGGTASPGVDFAAGPYTATFADGATTASFTVPITDDSIFEGSEPLVLTIAAVDNGGTIGSPNVATLTITDTDPQQKFNITDAQGYALSGTTLIPFSTLNPGAALAPIAVAGVAAGETLVGIDFRPQNGLLYGLGVNATADTATLYAISPRTGFAGVVGVVGGIAFQTGAGAAVDLPDPATTGYDIDFNPAVDRLRVVAGSLNFRIDPNSGLPIDGNLGGAANSVANTNTDGTINGGTTAVQGTAYTNNFPNNGNTTTQYALDAGTDKLFIQNPPNAGTQTPPAGLAVTAGGSPLDFTAVRGFDILANVNAPSPNAAPAAGSGFAVLTVGGTDRLYRIDLTTGAATLVGPIGATPATVQSLALQSDLGTPPIVGLSVSGLQLLRAVGLGQVFSVGITGVAAGETLVGIDFRPQTGQLFGLGVNAGTDKGTLYRIDPQTGAALAIGVAGQVAFTTDGVTPVDLPDPATAGYGFDFNPTVDRIRVTTSTGLNFRVNPNDGAPVDGNLGGAANTVTGTNPDANINGNGVAGVSAAAYTNSFGTGGTPAAPVGATTLYTLDAASDTLFVQNSANAGTQTLPLPVTLGGGKLDFTAVNGFDIPAGVRVGTSNAAVASGFGFATLTVAGTTSLYRIDLVTGAATLVAPVGAGANALAGLTLAETPAGTVAFAAATASRLENAGPATITLTRTGGSTGALTVSVAVTGGTATAGTDFTAGPYTVTFADGATTATLSIPLTADSAVEPDETIVLAIVAVDNLGVVGTQSTVTVTITNDDANRAPTLADPGPRQVDELTTLTIDLAGSDVDAGDTLTYSISAGLQPNMAIDPTTGRFTFTPNESQGPGDFGVTFRVTDSAGAFAERMVRITVAEVNIAPSLAALPDVRVARSGLVTPPAAATDPDVPANALTFSLASAVAGVTIDPATGAVTFPAGLASGTFGLTVTVTDSGGLSASRSFTATVAGRALGQSDVAQFAVETGGGGITVFGPDGRALYTLTAFAGQTLPGGVRLAVADVTGDGTPDVIAGTGPGVRGQVQVIDGATRQVVSTFDAFESSFTGGTFVTAADFDGDGTADIAVTPDVGGGPRVLVISGLDGSKLADFFGIDDVMFRGGARAGVGDVNGDGTPDLVVAAGRLGGPRVAVFDGLSLRPGTLPRRLFGDLYVFEQSLRDGVYVSAGDIDGDGKAELIAGGGPGGGPRVLALSGADLLAGLADKSRQVSNFFAGDSLSRNGVRVSAKDFDRDGRADLVVAAGTGTTELVKGYNGRTLSQGGTPASLFELDAAGAALGGVDLG